MLSTKHDAGCEYCTNIQHIALPNNATLVQESKALLSRYVSGVYAKLVKKNLPAYRSWYRTAFFTLGVE